MKVSIWWIVIGVIILFVALKSCEGKPKVVTKTVTKIETIHDTINTVSIKEIPKKVYIERTKTIKGKDSIIYKDKPSEGTTTANQFETTLEANDATAKLLVTTTGELLDLSGKITYPEKETTTETIITRDASGLYLYGSMPITSRISPEIGAMFQMKNKLIIGVGVQYNDFTRNLDATATLAIKVW